MVSLFFNLITPTLTPPMPSQSTPTPESSNILSPHYRAHEACADTAPHTLPLQQPQVSWLDVRDCGGSSSTPAPHSVPIAET